MPIKPFLSYDQQIDKLINDKHLKTENPDCAKEMLKNIGYFALIGGYKTPFIDPMTRIYKSNTSFEDIVALYQFDQKLRESVFNYICKIERKIGQLISYEFCRNYGEDQKEYLSINNYNRHSRNNNEITNLIKRLNFLAVIDNSHEYIIHQRNTHNNVPLWALINTLTFGQLSKFYSLLTFNLQSSISKEYPNLNEKKLGQYLKVLTLFRNICAHNECLYSYKSKIDFPDTILHKKLKIAKTGNQYIKGKHDIFGVFIAFKYLLADNDFLDFKKSFINILKNYNNSSFQNNETKILDIMGFPQNWKKISLYKL